jgi:hypothetical protein
MRLARFSVLFSLLTLVGGCAATAQDDASSNDEAVSAGLNAGYFQVWRAGLPGSEAPFTGFRPNRLTTRCADGSKSSNLCPVDALDLDALHVDAGTAKALVPAVDDRNDPDVLYHGTLVAVGGRAVLKVDQAWRASKHAEDLRGGTFSQVQRASSGSFHRGTLNFDRDPADFAKVDFTAYPGKDSATVSRAMATPDGVLAYVSERDDGSLGLDQAYVRVPEAR